MTTAVVVVIVLALILGGLGLLIEGLFWLLIIALALIVAGAVMGMSGRRAAR